MHLKIFVSGSMNNFEGTINDFLREIPRSEIEQINVLPRRLKSGAIEVGEFAVFIWLREDAPKPKKGTKGYHDVEEFYKE